MQGDWVEIGDFLTFGLFLEWTTLPETNKNRPLEKEIPIGNHHF